MYSANFEYYRANSAAEAVQLLQAHPGAKLLAGGHSLLPQMKLRVAQPPAVVDISGISDLTGVSLHGDHIHIGAGTTHNMLATSAVLREHCPILAQAAGMIGDQQVRNRGTIGGSLAHADPAADLPTVMLALGATLTALGPGGSREIAASDFTADMFTTALAEDEVLVSISVPSMGSSAGGAYQKHDHPASGYAVVGVAAIVMVSGGACSGASIAVGGVTPKPQRASFDVSRYMQAAGYRIIPVNPVVAASGGQVLGEKAYASLVEAARHEKIELVNCFRNSEDIPPVVDEAITIGAKAVWMQLGISNAAAAEKAEAAGLMVVQDHCLKIDHRVLQSRGLI